MIASIFVFLALASHASAEAGWKESIVNGLGSAGTAIKENVGKLTDNIKAGDATTLAGTAAVGIAGAGGAYYWNKHRQQAAAREAEEKAAANAAEAAPVGAPGEVDATEDKAKKQGGSMTMWIIVATVVLIVIGVAVVLFLRGRM